MSASGNEKPQENGTAAEEEMPEEKAADAVKADGSPSPRARSASPNGEDKDMEENGDGGAKGSRSRSPDDRSRSPVVGSQQRTRLIFKAVQEYELLDSLSS